MRLVFRELGAAVVRPLNIAAIVALVVAMIATVIGVNPWACTVILAMSPVLSTIDAINHGRKEKAVGK